jgi:integrase
MSGKLTKRVVDAAKPGERDVFVWCGEVNGFGVKVTPAGSKVYVLQYRMGGRGNATRRYTIGKHGAPWTPDQAPAEGVRLLGLVAAGVDPQAAKSDAAKVETFRAAAALFVERHVTPNVKNAKEVERILSEAVAAWGPRPVTAVTRRDVIALLDRVVDRGAPIQANRLLAALRRMFNWFLEGDMVPASPCVNVKPPAAERSRDRVLDDDELRVVWQALADEPYPFGPLTRLLILTAQRRDEVAGMRWEEIDFDAATWTIPATRAKNGQAHEVPLSPPAVEELRALPRIGDLVFSTTETTAVSGFGRAKARLDARVTALRAAADPPAPPPARWTYHDLRRTAATVMARANVPPHVVDRLLNHVTGSIQGVAAIYNRHGYTDERRVALDAWARRLDQIVTGGGNGVVVPLRRRGS